MSPQPYQESQLLSRGECAKGPINLSNLFSKEKNVRQLSAERLHPHRGPTDPTIAHGNTQARASHPTGDFTDGGDQASAAGLRYDLLRPLAMGLRSGLQLLDLNEGSVSEPKFLANWEHRCLDVFSWVYDFSFSPMGRHPGAAVFTFSYVGFSELTASGALKFSSSL